MPCRKEYGVISVGSPASFSVTSHCVNPLAPAASCSVDVNFQPLEPGLANGQIAVPSDAVNGADVKLFVSGYGLLPADNDTFATARVINAAPYTAKMTTLNATRSLDDPAAACPMAVPNKSVWFRYTATADLQVTLDSTGSDYNPTFTVWTGKPGSFRNVTCAFQFSQAQPTVATVVPAARRSI